MSFNPYVPCNCRKENKTNWPSFRNKLEIREGLIDIKPEFVSDRALEAKFDSWKFCEHDQIAIEFSMAQSIIGWKSHIQKKYTNRFPNLEYFIPTFNDVSLHNYNKQETILEIKVLIELEDKEYQERLIQFIKLLEKAIELNQNIYW